MTSQIIKTAHRFLFLHDVFNLCEVMVFLTPIINASGQNNRFIAQSNEPWLALHCGVSFENGVWIEIIYCSSYFDKPVRPILRCILQNDYIDQILPAPVFGRAIWRGYVPVGTKALQISPTNDVSEFCFKVESLRVMSRVEVFALAFLKRPLKAILGVAARVAGYQYLSHVNLRHAIGATPFPQYDAWRKLRYRAFDRAGMDSGGEGSLPVVLVCEPKPKDVAWLKDFLARLQTQTYKNWRLCLGTFDLSLLPKDDRICTDCLMDNTLVMNVPVGAVLEPYALSVFADAATKHPKAQVFYADTDEISVSGRYENPRFKPAFDSLLFESQDFLGAAVCVRAGVDLSRAVYHHVARVVMSVSHIQNFTPNPTFPFTGGRSPSAAWFTRAPFPCKGEGWVGGSKQATIIIPTKNQYAIFKRCIDSIRRYTLDVEIIIVDNGSTEPNVISYLKELEMQGIKVLYRPEPFNFSKLCNDGAAFATKPFLVFLNNDTEIMDADWLINLLHFAAQADVGAVGAKLLYANRKLQHGGVILGLDGRAGHFERDLPEHDAGYFGRLNAPHEIAAVTGACLAVEATKFNAINGFDAVNLPVDLNDIDLCLRLHEKGWKTVLASNVILLHHESVSRTGSWKPDKKYAQERDYFSKRWIYKLRSSPQFHPALTMEGFRAKLG